MKLRNILWGVWGIILLSASCYDDQGNYDYNWITEVEVDKLPDRVEVVGDILNIQPTLTFINKEEKQSTTEDYSYLWIAVTRNSRDTIGRELNLNYRITLAPGTYQVEFQACDLHNDVSWMQKFSLKVMVELPEGWLFLQDKADQAELAFYARMNDGKMKLKEDMLHVAGIPEAQLEGPRQVFYMNSSMLQGVGIWTVTDKMAGYLDNDNGYLWNSSQLLRNYVTNSVDESFTVDKIMSDGSWYQKFMFSQGGKEIWFSRYAYLVFTNSPCVFKNEAFEVAPYVLGQQNAESSLFFDRTHKCFMGFRVGSASWYQLQGFPIGKDLIYMEGIGEMTNRQGFILLKDDAEHVYEYQVALDKLTLISDPENNNDWGVLPNLARAEQCVYHQTEEVPYYLRNNTLYVVRNRQEFGVTFYKTGSSENIGLEGEITLLYTKHFSDQHLYPYLGDFYKMLIVATKLSDGSGQVYFLTPDQGNAHRLRIDDVVKVKYPVIGMDYKTL